MSSREIAELTGKEHKHVMRDIRNMLDSLNLDESSFGRIYLDGSNREQIEYHLPKDLTLTLVSGDKGKRDSYVVVAQLSPEMTGKK